MWLLKGKIFLQHLHKLFKQPKSNATARQIHTNISSISLVYWPKLKKCSSKKNCKHYQFIEQENFLKKLTKKNFLKKFDKHLLINPHRLVQFGKYILLSKLTKSILDICCYRSLVL